MHGTDARLVLAGELDFADTPDVAAALGAVSESRGTVLTIDLTAATFIDSAIIALLLRLDRDARDRASQVVVSVAEGSAVLRTLEISGVCDLLTVFAYDRQTPATAAAGRRALRVLPRSLASE